MMAVVLGRPGAGCTTLLKALANQRQDYHKVLGDVWYDDFTPEEMHKHYRGDIQYSPEDDVHFATLTVRQTLDFAAKTRTPQARLAESREEHRNQMIDVLTTIFGLRQSRIPLLVTPVLGVSVEARKSVSRLVRCSPHVVC